MKPVANARFFDVILIIDSVLKIIRVQPKPFLSLSNRHIGDFGNILADETGSINVEFTDNVAKLNGQYSILGRTMLVSKSNETTYSTCIIVYVRLL